MKHAAIINGLSLLKLAHTTLLWNFPHPDIQKVLCLLIYEKMKRMGITASLLIEFGRVIFDGNIPDSISDKDIEAGYAVLKKKHKIYKKFFSPGLVYKYLFLLELAYILKLVNIKYDSSLFADMYKILKVNKKQRQLLEEYISLTESEKVTEYSMFFKDSQLKKNAVTVHPLTLFINNEKDYYRLPRRTISVFSTMSAGKSSFINALLGQDYLPSKNEACTAKIASITNIDYIDYSVGYAIRNGEPVFCGNVSPMRLQKWNNDSDITEINFEGNLDRTNSKKSVTVIYDSPGVNYSGNDGHKKITLDHLAALKPEIIVCLLDATQMFTTNFAEAVEDLKKTISTDGTVQVMFFINKSDCYDAKKESLGNMAADTAVHLEKYGFKNPIVVPVSSRAARLFKMALHGLTDFTENEIDDFTHYFKFFQRPENNFNLFASGFEQTQIANREYMTEGDTEIQIEGKSYKRTSILNAFFCTGIPLVEEILNTQKGANK